MSSATAAPVVACVAAVVAAYNDSLKLLHAMKKKKHRRGQSTESKLESSLKLGHSEILARWNMNAAQLGKRYEDGDITSRENMEEIFIKVQEKLLNQLRASVENNSSLDVNAALLVSDLGRARTIFVLQELYQRIAVTISAPLSLPKDSTVNPSSTMTRYMEFYQKHGIPIDPSSNDWPVLPDPSPPPRELQGNGMLPDGIAELDDEPASPSSRRRFSFFGSSTSSLWKTRPRNDSQLSFRSPPISSMGSAADENRSIASMDTIKLDIPYQRNQHAAELDATRELRDLHISPRKDEERSDSAIAMKFDENIFLSSEKIPVHSPVREEVQSDTAWSRPFFPRSQTTSSISKTSMISGKNESSVGSTPLLARTVSPAVRNKSYWPPRRDNKYAGFCKGAWKLSFGTGKLVYNSEPYGFYGYRQRWCCPCCFFSSEPGPPTPKKEAKVDQTIYEHEETGIRYRWLFLAKSHIAKKEGITQDTSGFGCIFCVAESNVPAPVSLSVDDFMNHLVSHSRVDPVGMLAELTKLVVGRAAQDDEDFEINIPRS